MTIRKNQEGAAFDGPRQLDPNITAGHNRNGQCTLTFSVERDSSGVPFQTREELLIDRADVERLVRELSTWLKRVS